MLYRKSQCLLTLRITFKRLLEKEKYLCNIYVGKHDGQKDQKALLTT